MAPTSVLCLLTLLIGAHCSVFNRRQVRQVGQPADVDSFPWVALLSVTEQGEPDDPFLYAGSLISTRHVLTAAHCFDDIQEYTDVKIFLGAYDNSAYPVDCVKDKCRQKQIVYPDKIIMHEEYDDHTVANDIALLRLQKRVLVSAYVQPIPLPPFEVDDNINDGASLLVTDFRILENGDISDILQPTELSLISKKRCLKIDADILQGHLCAGSSAGEETFIGDEGGPLMMYHEKKCYLAGVLSYGPVGKHGMSEVGYYTNVFKYMKWIKTNMNI